MLFECSPRSQLVFSTILEYRFSAVIVGFKSEDIVRMFARGVSASLLFLSFITCTQFLFAGDTIPKAAWKRGIGQPLENAGGRKPALGAGMIDDGYWQGAPVGGFGAGTFSRSYRGEFERWHLKTGVHKYQKVPANQFSIYAKAEGATSAYAQVLATDAPESGNLSSWKWHYPVGKGEYAALYP